MATLSLDKVSKRFGETEVLHGIDLEIADQEFVVFVGPSGCGKSTLLRLIAGLEPISGGTLRVNDADMTRVPPARRDIAMVFQSYALYPHMDVYENMAFGVRILGLTKDEIDGRVHEAARMLQLEPLLKRKPRELSGGQRQRVAIGRAITRKPKVFLLDEPLSNLDAALRSQVRLEIARLHREIGGTMIYVTHDQIEAMTLADKIVVMNEGRIEQVGSPRELYETPANAFVGTFIGSPKMTLVTARREGRRFSLSDGGAIEADAPADAKGDVMLGMRPDALTLTRDRTAEGFEAETVYTEYLGNEAYAYVRLADGTMAAVAVPPNEDYGPDEPVRVQARSGMLHFFDPESGRRLRHGSLADERGDFNRVEQARR
ncbi:ABC transporter ATP-binding protein [Pararhizobium mangrovi]|uniref:sn-glycerol-3-phosphate ABC transporter ATP-binding protein UgpC n=1 Tax=Pararhizobium mangrovi TaxID=2590452 RepID=A0A506TZA7_9HYPH|nr:sn-glycerol-3-phosphate ABC transporter ATP-binding protein UgpC [Pararhizobium mangrovi]TPW26321.1 sn-glycerol-3-phosphate ABC transporter ATP-binding protein UgpC [Pararhizobium mangrovi]